MFILSFVKKISYLIVVSCIASSSLLTSNATAQGSASLYVTPASESIKQGSAFSVTVFANSPSEPLVAVEIAMTYPESLLTFTGFDISESAFDIEAPRASGANGRITMVRASADERTGAAIEVVKINFTTKTASGIAELAFAGGNNLLLTATENVLGSTTGAAYNVFSDSDGSQPEAPTAPNPSNVPTDGTSTSILPDQNSTDEASSPNSNEEDDFLGGDVNSDSTETQTGPLASITGPNANPVVRVMVIAGAGLAVLVVGFVLVRFIRSKTQAPNKAETVSPVAGQLDPQPVITGSQSSHDQVDKLLNEVHAPTATATKNDELDSIEFRPQSTSGYNDKNTQ